MQTKYWVTLIPASSATLVVDGRGFKVTDQDQGYFVGPTLFDNVKAGMRIYEEEINSPVLSVVRVNSQKH